MEEFYGTSIQDLPRENFDREAINELERKGFATFGDCTFFRLVRNIGFLPAIFVGLSVFVLREKWKAAQRRGY